MNMNTEQMQLFEEQAIRTAWDEENEEWYFSIVDVVGALTESVDATGYWRKLKQRLKEEGNETVTNCHALKMKAADGKRRFTDVANTEQLLRIIQSIPSKKAEPFKLWLAQVGRERIEETMDPELIAERLIATYERKGYTREWINQNISKVAKPSGFEENKQVARRGGSVADVARMALEEQTGIPVITSQNAIQLNHVVEAMIEASVSITNEKTRG